MRFTIILERENLSLKYRLNLTISNTWNRLIYLIYLIFYLRIISLFVVKFVQQQNFFNA